MLEKITPNIMVNNVNETSAYYNKYLGFTIQMAVDEKNEITFENFDSANLIWALLKKDAIELMVQRSDSFIEELPDFKDKKPGGTFTLFISTDDVKTIYESIKNEVNIVKHLYETTYGTSEFVIKDLNGYIVCFAESQNE